METIKRRRLTLPLDSRPGLHVGDCVPFYFCPRSIMLYMMYMSNHPDLSYAGGQQPIIHLEADLRTVVEWAEDEGRRWAFTLSNAGSNYFEDRADLDRLDEIDWSAVQARDWRSCKAQKQAEFLVERSLPWKLIERIGVYSAETRELVGVHLRNVDHCPDVEIERSWYY